ncbi:AMP-binding protein, partial [Pseudomonas aeruginosa]|uniref:AMP-binding protein n=1 Tax=Pseudomonas aeruginosa TaxID=287 RepID=UPI0031B6F067
AAGVHGEIELSYRELNRRANVLAHRLRAEGVGPDVPVGIAMQRSPELVVALLAALKAGGAYVPMDPSYPAERLAFLAEDSGIGLLLTQTFLQDELPFNAQLTNLCLDDPSLF